MGELLAHALTLRPRSITVGVGGLACHDGGAAMLAALGVGDRGQLDSGGLALADLPYGALDGLAAARARLGGTQLVVATASARPLLGFGGAAATTAQARGATPEEAQALEGALGRLVDVAVDAGAHGLDLLTGRPLPLDRAEGAGAGGGLGYGLLLLGARRVDGVACTSALAGLREAMAQAHLVVSGTAELDWSAMLGGVVVSVAETAGEWGVPVVVVPGTCPVSRREWGARGISAVYPLADGWDAEAALASAPDVTLAARAERVARSWSPPGRLV